MDSQFHKNQDTPKEDKVVKLIPFKDQSSAITLYAVLSILRRMRSDLGLEAMLEYMDCYRALIEKYNPQFHQAISSVLKQINIDKVYTDAMHQGENQEPGSR